MNNIPKFIKDFSKEKSSEERQQTAESVRVKRQENFAEEKANEEKELLLNEKLKRINDLENEISRLSESGLSKILNYFQLKKLQADLAIGQKTYEELKQQTNFETVEDKDEIPSAFQETKAMVEEFYSEQEKKWENTEYSKEDIKKYFSEDNLASLSLEDYTLLLKRFPSEMVTHVTRQGVRDHVGLMYHTAGDGKYADGFKNMANDGRLRSPLGVHLIEEEKEKAIAKFLRLDEFENKEEALKNLNIMTDPAREASGSYADRMAIHFATEEVADCYYGSEKGNEIFIAYPSAYISSQYYFNGQLNQAGGGYWNDQWVYANEEKGISLNAGVVFIPEGVNVDKETGSRYELDKENNPIKNENYIAAIRALVDSDDFNDFAKQAMDITGKSDNVTPESLEPLIKKLEKDFNITDPKIQRAVIDYQNLFDISVVKKEEQLSPDEPNPIRNINSTIESVLKNEGILFKETTNKIDSKEYWESYFNKNAKAKLAHIVYYKAESPTEALNKWKEKNGLNKKSSDSNIGFSENRIMQADAPQAIAGMDRFKVLAEKIINEYYLD